MAIFVILLYLTLAYLRPFVFIPALQPIHLMQIVGGAALVMTIAYAPITEFSFKAKQLYLMMAFAFFVIISPTVTLHWFGGSMQTLEEFGITVVVFCIVLINVTTARRLRRVLTAICVLSAVLAIQSIAAAHFGFYTSMLTVSQVIETTGQVLYRVRATGFMEDPNDLAQSLVMAIPLIALAWRRGRLMRGFLFALIPIAVILYAIYLTHSRGAIVSLLVIVMVATRRKLGRGLAALFTIGAFFAGALLNFTGGRAISSADASAFNRIEAWSTGLQLLKAHPFFGIGYHEFTSHHEITAHNSVVLCFSELGFPAFCLWVGLIVVSLVELNAVRKFKPRNQEEATLWRYASATQLGFYGYLVSAWFLSRTYVMTLYLLIALAAAIADIARRNGTPMPTFTVPKLAGYSVGTSVGLIALIYLTIKFSVR